MKMFILSGFSLLLVLFFSSCVKPSSPSSISDQTVMLHWLDLDEEGIVRLANADGNFFKANEDLFRQGHRNLRAKPDEVGIRLERWKTPWRNN